MVFYRKYRPQKIDDLDSTSVRETLNAILQKNIPHAFLFTGPKGLGKTSTARIVAKVVNCQTPAKKRENGLEPCNTCDQCISITNGTNVDILEIDAASNRGIDEIRELKEKIRLSPVAATKKVYIIDEVHMLTTEAFNALLKTLEEPPDHAMFILCTTEAHKVPETIVSRCFQIMFKPATEEELVRSFKRIVAGEKIQFKKDEEDKVLQYIAEMSDKGFRDGVKILEEVSLMSQGRELSIELIESTYKTVTSAIYTLGLFNALKAQDPKKALKIVQDLVEQGGDVKHFASQILIELHDVLLREMGVLERQKTSDHNFSKGEIKQLADLFGKAYLEMKTSVLPQLSLELAIIEWCEGTEQTQPTVIARSETTKQTHGDRHATLAMTNEEEVSVTSLRKQVGTMKKIKALYGEKKTEPVEEEITITTTSVELMHTNGDGPVTKEWMEHFWTSLISEMKKYNHTVAGVLRGCTIKSFTDQNLIIQTAYKFHKERLDDMKNREALLKIAKLLTGKDVEITVQLKNK